MASEWALAIDESILFNKIVHLPYYTSEDYALLKSVCADYVEGETETEFWGTNEGQNWRVHMLNKGN